MTIKKIKLDVPNLEGQVSIMFSRGGTRDGAGRKGIGKTKKISLTLAEDMWTEIEARCNKSSSSKSQVLRDIIEAYFHSNERDR